MLKHTIMFAAVVGLVFGLGASAQAQTYNWDQSVRAGSWETTGNWVSPSPNPYPNLPGDIAVISYPTYQASIYDATWGHGVQVVGDVTVGVIDAGGSAAYSGPVHAGHPDGNYVFENFLSHLYGTGKIIWDNNGTGALFDQSGPDYRDPGNSEWSVAMELADNLEMKIQTQRNRRFSSTITESGGPRTLTLSVNGRNFYISGSSPNTYSGGTVLEGSNPLFLGEKDGAFGTGDVTLVATASGAPELKITDSGGVDNRIDDSASLYLSHDATGGYTVVTLDGNVDETIFQLYLDGFPASPGTGTYNATTHPNWFAGTGNLITTVPEPASAVLLLIGAPLLALRRRRRS